MLHFAAILGHSAHRLALHGSSTTESMLLTDITKGFIVDFYCCVLIHMDLSLIDIKRKSTFFILIAFVMYIYSVFFCAGVIFSFNAKKKVIKGKYEVT